MSEALVKKLKDQAASAKQKGEAAEAALKNAGEPNPQQTPEEQEKLRIRRAELAAEVKAWAQVGKEAAGTLAALQAFEVERAAHAASLADD